MAKKKKKVHKSSLVGKTKKKEVVPMFHIISVDDGRQIYVGDKGFSKEDALRISHSLVVPTKLVEIPTEEEAVQ